MTAGDSEEAEAVRIVRRSPGRLRLHAPSLGAAEAVGIERLTALGGVRHVQFSALTGNVLIEFDQSSISEPDLLTLVAGDCALPSPSRSSGGDPLTDVEGGWRRAERSATIRARPAECVATLLAFELYPEWQTYVTAVRVDERDGHGRGVRVTTRAEMAEREFEFTARYRFPSPNRIVFEQQDGEHASIRGNWAFRGTRPGLTRATCVLEVRPGWRLGLVLRGDVYERARDAVLDHLIGELRMRVED